MIGWYEHTSVAAFVGLSVCYFVTFMVDIADIMGTLIVAAIFSTIFFIVGIVWMRQGRVSGPGVGIFIAALLMDSGPVIALISVATIIPLAAIVGGGGAIMLGLILFSSLLENTSRPIVHKLTLSLSVLLYIGGIILASVWMRSAVRTGFEIFDARRSDVTAEWENIKYGMLITMLGAILGAVAFYFARVDHDKNVQAEQPYKETLMPGQAVYGSVIMPGQPQQPMYAQQSQQPMYAQQPQQPMYGSTPDQQNIYSA